MLNEACKEVEGEIIHKFKEALTWGTNCTQLENELFLFIRIYFITC